MTIRWYLWTKLKLTKKVLKNRESLTHWLFLVHNKVQEDIYKKSNDENYKPKYKNNEEDYKKVYNFYEKFRAKCHKTKTGCSIPLKGIKKKVKIYICPQGNNYRANKSIIMNKKCK